MRFLCALTVHMIMLDKVEGRGLSDISKSVPHTVTRRDYSNAPPGVVEDIPYALQVLTSDGIFIET